ncbi:MFS transporter [Micrococcus sp. TA1]|uniref:MFS transporter n=1 Tax=Micrococcus sp. TA1 TaxID=681627 RepID=UPI0017F042BA|nr:MFS transporter [Micrococcus sp. TA1]MBB5749961.1 putative MFS family arabinose efflux permease [Micrococcus sp. TA1]
MPPASAVPPGPSRLWSRDFILASLTNLFLAMVFYLLVTVMALYAVDRFQASDAMSGLAVGAYVLGAVFARLLTGQAMDSLGRRRVLIGALIAFLLASTLYLLANTLALLITVRFVHGIAFGAAATVLAASVIGLIPRHRRSEGTGWFGTSTTAGSAFGPLLAFQLTDAFGFDSLFLACTVFSLFGLAAGLVVRLPAPPRPDSSGPRLRFSVRGMLSPQALPVSIVILLAGTAFSGVLAFLNGYAQQEGISPTVASSFFLIYGTVLVATRFVVGPIHDRFGDNAAVVPLLVSFMIALAVLAAWPVPAGIFAAAALTAIGFGALLTSLQAIAVTVVPPLQIGVATSTYFIMLDLGIGLGPVILGALLPVTGYSGMYLALACLMALTIGVYWLVHGRRPAARRRTRGS